MSILLSDEQDQQRFSIYGTLNDRVSVMRESFAQELEEAFCMKRVRVYIADMRGHDSGQHADIIPHKFIVESGWDDNEIIIAVDEEGERYPLCASYVMYVLDDK